MAGGLRPDRGGNLHPSPSWSTDATTTGSRWHVPDVLLLHADCSVTLVDVKPAAFLDEPPVQIQFNWTRGLDQVWRGSDDASLGGVQIFTPELLEPPFGMIMPAW